MLSKFYYGSVFIVIKIKLLFHSEIIVGLFDAVTAQSSIKKKLDVRSLNTLTT